MDSASKKELADYRRKKKMYFFFTPVDEVSSLLFPTGRKLGELRAS
jgi:hypothetical protein